MSKVIFYIRQHYNIGITAFLIILSSTLFANKIVGDHSDLLYLRISSSPLYIVSNDATEFKTGKMLNQLYDSLSYQIIWSDNKGLNANGKALLNTINKMQTIGLNENNYFAYDIYKISIMLKLGLSKNYKQRLRVDLELLLSEAFFLLAADIHKGMIDKQSYQRVWKFDLLDFNVVHYLIDAIKNQHIEQQLLQLQPKHLEYASAIEAYNLLKKHLQKHNDTLNLNSLNFSKKEKISTKQALLYHHYIDSINIADSTYTKALCRFQYDNGLNPDGIIGKNTIAAFRLSCEERLLNLLANIEKWKWEDEWEQDYVFINIPSYQLHFIKQGKIVRSHKIVIGKKANKTPELVSKINRITILPEWRVPYSIASKEMLPKIKKDSSYLERNHFKVYNRSKDEIPLDSIDWKIYDENNLPFRFVQAKGTSNALGTIKFNFPNKYSVYLHDTPSKSLFDKDIRSFSHGCMRLEHPDTFAQVILDYNEINLPMKKLESIIEEGEQKVYELKKPLTIYIKYFTCLSGTNGKVIFYQDIYDKDERLKEALCHLL